MTEIFYGNEARRRIFFIASIMMILISSVAYVLSTVLYIYFESDRRSLETKSSALLSMMSGSEAALIKARSEITLDTAHKLGFVDRVETYVERTSTFSFGLTNGR